MNHPTADRTVQVRNSVIYLTSAFLAQTIPIGALAILSRLLDKEAFGLYALAQIYGTFAAGLANFGLLLGYEREFFAYRERRDAAALLYSTLGFVLAGLSVILLLTWILRGPLAGLVVRAPHQGGLLFWTACAVGASSLKTYYLTYFRNTENARAYGGWMIGEAVLEAALATVLVAYAGSGVAGLAYGQGIAGAAIFLLLTARFVRTLPPAYDARILAGSLRLSAPLTPRIFFGVLGAQADKYLLALLSSVGGVGIYSIGQRIASAAFQYMTALQNVYAPRVYRQMFAAQEAGGRAIGRYLTTFAYLSAWAPLLLILFAEELVTVLTPSPYHAAATVVMILSLYYAFLFFGKVGGAQLIFARKTGHTTALTALAISLNVALAILLIRRWGPEGAAWAALLSGVLSGAAGVVVSQRSYRIGWETRKLALIFGWLVCAAVGLLVVQALWQPYYARVMLKLAALFGFFVLGWRLRLIPSIAMLRADLGPTPKGRAIG